MTKRTLVPTQKKITKKQHATHLIYGIFLNSLISLCLIGCYTVPETGRSSLNLMSEGSVASMSASSFDELKTETPISKDVEKNKRVQQISHRIVSVAVQSADLPPVDQWEFVLFDDDKVKNAFAMPGGKVGVYTGLFELANSDDELAVVIGHEVAHVAARHGNERLSQNILISGIGLGLFLGTMNQDTSTRVAILGAYGAGSTLGVILPFSRKDEAEADYIGLIYMARAGYNPEAAVTFWQKMKEQKSSTMPEIFSTHPADETRIENIKRQLPQVIPIYESTIKKEAP